MLYYTQEPDAGGIPKEQAEGDPTAVPSPGGVPGGCELGAPRAVRDLVQAPSPSWAMWLSSPGSSPLFQEKIFLLTGFHFFFHVFCSCKDLERPTRISEVCVENIAEEEKSLFPGKGKGKIHQRISLAFT